MGSGRDSPERREEAGGGPEPVAGIEVTASSQQREGREIEVGVGL